ncbi:methyltransferase domain-containing protein [Methanospirillum sp. J.3.6.1-F.2.7.3]|uniref:Methyltransferase domain-containing protein n=1 Tax=Methanospirillum purgamenti TaxID=2834276 RepID=A0A8E7EJL2_9EURY|nr:MULTISPECIES: class I SAM-dependent methyltransferase [Methanospirillum]MDX8549484.1 class I SAM-dependent methyltransferase [Methanospirillum hungatei]QVV89234.1 methyltransferase domain-containing protein [Methanospirillum sp. J.3.6.1-F.2.7.3]
MNSSERDATIIRYSNRFKEFGYSPKTLGWSKNKEIIRHKIMSQIGVLDNHSVLDVGCGFGDLLKYFKNENIHIQYTGIDLNPDLVAIARDHHPEANFVIADFEDGFFDNKYDWILSSGIFNHKLDDNYQFITNVMRKMFEKCLKGFAADFLTSYVDFKEPNLFYAEPERVFSICKKFSKRIILRADYMPFENCIYCFKNDKFNEKTVFSEFDHEQSL